MADNQSTVLAWPQTQKGAEHIRAMVSSSPMAKLAGLEESLQALEEKALALSPGIILLEMPGGINGTASLLERLRRKNPRSSLMVLSDSDRPEDILSALRLGVREYLTEPVEPQEFNDAVLRLLRQETTAGTSQGSLISVMGVKGGVGASSVALNLAWALSRDAQNRIALVDLDIASGDLAWMLDEKPGRDLTQVAANFDRLDASFMEGILIETSPGLHLLAAPPDAIAAEEVKSEHVQRALELLRDSHQMVVADLPSRLDEVGLTALERSDKILLVLEPTMVGLKAARRLLSLSEEIWGGEGKLSIVVNRDGSRGGLPPAEVQRALGQKPSAYLPNDSRTVMEAANCGRPAMGERPKMKWSKAVAGLAAGLSPQRKKGAK